MVVNIEIVLRYESAVHHRDLLHIKDFNNTKTELAFNNLGKMYIALWIWFDSCNTTTKKILFNGYCQAGYES